MSLERWRFNGTDRGAGERVRLQQTSPPGDFGNSAKTNRPNKCGSLLPVWVRSLNSDPRRLLSYRRIPRFCFRSWLNSYNACAYLRAGVAYRDLHDSRVVVIGDIVELPREPLLRLQRRLALWSISNDSLLDRIGQALLQSRTDLPRGNGSHGEVLPAR